MIKPAQTNVFTNFKMISLVYLQLKSGVTKMSNEVITINQSNGKQSNQIFQHYVFLKNNNYQIIINALKK